MIPPPPGGNSREGVWCEPQSHRPFFYRVWIPAQATRLLVIIHGFGEHGGRYRPVAEGLAGQGLAVAVADLWGHGRSGGSRGDAEGVMRYVDDVHAVTSQVFLPMVGVSSFAVYGHSAGGLLAIHWALRQPTGLAWLIIQSPLLELGLSVPSWKAALARWLGRWWPSARLAMNLDAQALSHNAEVVRAYRDDRLVHNRMSARIYGGILQAGVEALAQAHRIDLPTLLLYGEADRIVSIAAAQRWFNALRCQKRLVSFPGAYHELHHETVRGEVFRLIREWTAPPVATP